MKAVVLLSGGIDSTTCLYMAALEIGAGHVSAISFDYGQRHRNELQYAARSCSKLHIPHKVIGLEGLIPQTMLTTPSQRLPNASYAQLEGVSPTYVPFRNGLLLSVMAAQAQVVAELAQDEVHIYFGAHREDAANWAYPDCTPEFIGAMANAIYIGSYHRVRLATPLEWLNKHEVVAMGDVFGVDFALTWSCYAGGERHCGTCPTCRARREAFADAQVEDPTEYEAAVH